MLGRISGTALVVVAGLVAMVSWAEAGTSGAKVVKDPTDLGGKLYDAKIYARCDIKQVKAKVKGGKLVIGVTHRGKQEFPNTYLNINTKGGKTSAPEYRADPSGGLIRTKGSKYTAEAVKVKQKSGGKVLQFALPLKQIGRPKKTGFQAETCGEGAVDIAPGKNYFDDKGWDGKIDYQYKSIRTRS